MPIFFKDTKDNLFFEYYDSVPAHGKGPVNLTLLQLYGLYRNTIFDSYSNKIDLAEDIKVCEMQYPEKAAVFSKRANQPVYQYSVKGSLGAMKDWKDSKPQVECFIAYENVDGKVKKVGFVHFVQKEVNKNKLIYIESMGVAVQGKSIGRRLMECVLSHFPAGTEFQIGTRIFNTEAKTLYEKRLNFKPVGLKELEENMGLNAKYCGFKKVTTNDEIQEIKQRTTDHKMEAEALEMKEEVSSHRKNRA